MKNWFESKYSLSQLKDIYKEYYKSVHNEDASDVPGNRCTYAALLEDLDRQSRDLQRA